MKKSVVAVLLIVLFSFSAHSYGSYNYDVYGDPVPAPDAYWVKKIIAGEEMGVERLNNPQDIFVDGKGVIYLSDTGKNRILMLDKNFELINEIKNLDKTDINTLSEPNGLFVDEQGFIYVCDSGNERAVKINKNGEVFTEYKKPETKVLSEDYIFKPNKIAVDSSSGVYIVAFGLYQGLLYYNQDGEFQNFYGSNRVEPTLAVVAENMWKKLFTKEQREALSRTIPTEYSNLFVDKKSFIYTTTLKTSNSLDEAKKLNALGNNVLRFHSYNTYYPKNNFGDISIEWLKGQRIDNAFIDLYVDDNEIMALLDRERCRIFEYNNENDLLLVYGEKGNKKGEFLNPVAIDKIGNDYIILDAEKNNITILSPTDYAIKLKNVMKLYSDGYYEKTIDEFTNLLQQNNNLTIAYKGIGKAYMQQEHYKTAMNCFKKSSDRQEYSDAFKEYRKVFVRQNIVLIIIVIIGTIFSIKILIKKIKAWLLSARNV